MKIDVFWLLVAILVMTALKALYRRGERSRVFEWEYSLDHITAFASTRHTRYVKSPTHPGLQEYPVEAHIHLMERSDWELCSVYAANSGFDVLMRRKKASVHAFDAPSGNRMNG
jgi:hypothetical protein